MHLDLIGPESRVTTESHGCHSPARDMKSTTDAESWQGMTGEPERGAAASLRAGSAAALPPRSVLLDLLNNTRLIPGQTPGTKIPLFAPHHTWQRNQRHFHYEK